MLAKAGEFIARWISNDDALKGAKAELERFVARTRFRFPAREAGARSNGIGRSPHLRWRNDAGCTQA
jgi:hypothetical protein